MRISDWISDVCSSDLPDALAAILAAWRELTDRSVLLFTGHEISDIQTWLSAHLDLVDAIVTGPFRAELPQTKAMRGSDTQQLHRSEERRVGKACVSTCRSRWSRVHIKKQITTR